MESESPSNTEQNNLVKDLLKIIAGADGEILAGMNSDTFDLQEILRTAALTNSDILQ